MKLSFIKKFRPTNLSEFCFDSDLANVLEIMKNINNMNILLVGNSGNGKTTLINILLESYFGNINNENIMYINNLKDQGISYYRTDVKTFCQIPCTVKNKKKIVVIDDIDYINDQSQQVFRNCIDKYGHNIQFLCSCVNTQKVIDSIQSRLTIIKLLPVKNDKLHFMLEHIINQEGITFTDDAKDFIVSISNSSIRTLINYLEKIDLMTSKTFNLTDVKKLCTNICFDNFEYYIKLCVGNERERAFEYIMEIFNMGFSAIDIYDTFFIFVKSSEIISETNKYEIIKLLCKYITIFHNIHEHEVELILFTNDIINLICVKNEFK